MTTPTSTSPDATIGQAVWFYPGKFVGNMNQLDNDQPMLARVVFVNDDGTVNLFVVDHLGGAHSPRNVPIYKDGDKEKDGSVEYVMLQPAKKPEPEKKAELTFEPVPEPVMQFEPTA